MDCASKCQNYEMSYSWCNAFKYNEQDQSCSLALLNYLEDPNDGEEATSIMISESAEQSLKMYCRGGENCCGREDNRLCGEGEGDCDHDDQCSGHLRCGNNNCVHKSGGLWDHTDDCCERRCSADRPCDQGQGPCYSNSDCLTAGTYLVCSKQCINRFVYPLDKFPKTASIYGFASGDKCCRFFSNINIIEFKTAFFLIQKKMFAFRQSEMWS